MTFLIHVLTSPQVIFFCLVIFRIKIIDHAMARPAATHGLKNENSLIGMKAFQFLRDVCMRLFFESLRIEIRDDGVVGNKAVYPDRRAGAYPIFV